MSCKYKYYKKETCIVKITKIKIKDTRNSFTAGSLFCYYLKSLSWLIFLNQLQLLGNTALYDCNRSTEYK